MNRIHVALAVATLAGPLLAQAAAGLTPEQVMKMRRVTGAILGQKAIAYVVSEPRPAEQGPGPAYRHLYAIPDFDDAVAGHAERRRLVAGKNSVRGEAFRPGTDEITLLHTADGRRQVHGISPQGGVPYPIAETPNSVLRYAWRPDGKALAYTSLDAASPQRQHSRSQGFEQKIVDEDFRHVSLWLWQAAEGDKEARIEKLTEGRTVIAFRWAPHGDKLAITMAPRNLIDDSYMFQSLFLLDPTGNTLRPLVRNPGKLGGFAWSPDGSAIAYISAADRNDPHAGMLYVKNIDTGETRALTPGFRGMVHEVKWPEPSRLVCLISRGVQTELVRMDPKSGDIAGTLHKSTLAIGSFDLGLGGRVALVGSAPQHPGELFVGRMSASGQLLTKRATLSNRWLNQVALGRQEVVAYEARDGVAIEGLLMYPVGYQAGRRYPMVIVAHGGPESHFLNGWNTGYGRWGQMLCARGYFAWYPNYRASTGYGVEFAKADHGDPMGGEFRDHLDAIEHFDELGLIDRTRVGIGGGSYGGYTAAWAATRHSEHFAAAVSFVPFVDIRTKWLTSDIPWEFYYVHYQEQWPWEQPGFLADRSPLSWATDCETPLLLLGGTSDPRVHPSQPFMLYRAVKFGTETPVRYVQYPGEGHGNRSNVYQYDYALRTLRWFDHYLKGDGDRRSRPLPHYDVDYSGWAPPPPRETEDQDEPGVR